MRRAGLIIILFLVISGCDVRYAGYMYDGSIITDNEDILDTGVSDTVRCEEYKYENYWYGTYPSVYIDR